MKYNSTRNSTLSVDSAKAINDGISKDGGLFVPNEMPKLDKEFFVRLSKMNYIDRAGEVLRLFLTDFTDEEIKACTKGAYAGTFDNDCPAPLYRLNDNTSILELWHGPTCAFKDMALQILPYLLTTSSKKVADGQTTVILVATSGDTGKAALEGFKDVENTKIIVFYPVDGVSNAQKLQMMTQEGENVYVCAIKGNFDDAQTGVKKIFTNPDVAAKLAENGMAFSSANSINWGRLLPQIVYYISAYCDLIAEKGEVDSYNVVVPTGNFGNILAAYYAKKMGAPINKLICASNSNKVLTDFIESGVYDRNRSFYTTISPSMDILISSNLERLIYDMSGCDSELISGYMAGLSADGKYEVNDKIKAELNANFVGGYATDDETKAAINETYKTYNYLADTHTGVAIKVYNDYVKNTGDKTETVIVSTASPYKFSADVLEAVDSKSADHDGIKAMAILSEVTGTKIPTPLSGLDKRTVRFEDVCDSDDMIKAVYGYLEI
ncbi:MAG: threonine synthase [Acutalibacteraceae bacterium]|nr:threonine synthase [Acutalibacteraceae bacterium]